VKAFVGFITLVAMLVFMMGLVTHPTGTAAIINSTSKGLVDLFTLELGAVPGSAGAPTQIHE
jgi:hypothetical protein